MDAVPEILTKEKTIPLHYTFLWKGKWLKLCIPNIGFATRKIHDRELTFACKQYLIRTGANFDSMDQLEEWAIRHDWGVTVDQLPQLT